MKTWYVIPARKSSKGIKYKNRILFDYTAGTIPPNLASSVILSSDDPELLSRADELGFIINRRSPSLADDYASVKDVLLEVIDKNNIGQQDTIVLLYLTYPQRTWADVELISSFFKENDARSVVCAEAVTDHPFLCLYDLGNHRAKQIVEHGLYRRQDYPPCFRYSLFVAVYRASEIAKLNDLLFCEDSLFYKLEKRTIDVDHTQDLINLELSRNAG